MKRNLLSPKQEKMTLLTIVSISFIVMLISALSRQFITDDWLWLNHAGNISTNPAILMEKPMYGYFRPAFMVWISILKFICGKNAILFSLTHIVLHCINVLLLWKILKLFNVKQSIRLFTALFFGTYFLNVSAVGWISVGHDLWVLLLSFIFCIICLSYIEKPTIKKGFLIFITGLLAILFKENGIVTLGLYFLCFIYRKVNPFSKNCKIVTVSLSLFYLLYIIWFFLTRGYVNNETEISITILGRLWFLLAYSLSPLTEATCGFLPSIIVVALLIVRYGLLFMLPIVFIHSVLKKKTTPLIGFSWAIMFLSTVAIMKTESSLLSAYPSILMTRYFYVAMPGVALVFMWTLSVFCDYIRLQKSVFKYLLILIIPVYLLSSTFAGFKGNRSIRSRGVRTERAIACFNEEYSSLLSSDTLMVVGVSGKVPQTFAQCDFPPVEMKSHFESLLAVQFGKDITVVNMEFKEKELIEAIDWGSYEFPVLLWDSVKDQLVLINNWHKEK